MRLAGMLLAAVSLSAALTAPQRRDESFLPPNDLKIEIGSLEDKGLTQQQFDEVLDRVEAVYKPIIAAKGGKLVVNRKWADGTVNASAQRSGQNYIINMYGGLARHQAVTQDGFAVVACHELGHHLGGAPRYPNSWASNEGESDYFANAKCLRRVFADPAAAGFTRKNGGNDPAAAACASAFKNGTDKERALCLRSAMAGLSVSELLRQLGNQPPIRFDTPDPKVVTKMLDSHPPAQCRLDTYFQGALCTVAATTDIGETDPRVGACTRAQGFTHGVRPRCWYLPPAGEPAPAAASAIPAKDRSAMLDGIGPGVFSGL